MTLEDKFRALKKQLGELESVAIAFSGGVDSTFLAKTAFDVLGSRAVAVTATSTTYPKREFSESLVLSEKIGIRQIIIESEETEIEGFKNNPPNRCYFCKHELFSKVMEVARKENLNYVLDGSNHDDLGDFRPGSKAARELKVISPLMDAQLTKDDIRALSKDLDLPTWDKPAFACLSSRFPYGQEIVPEKLSMVEEAEDYLLSLGFRQLRVRHHGEVARIEIAPEERSKLFDISLMDRIALKFKEIGFTYTAVELAGYRMGSMNAVLHKKEKQD